jgi:hypothetical protein
MQLDYQSPSSGRRDLTTSGLLVGLAFSPVFLGLMALLAAQPFGLLAICPYAAFRIELTGNWRAGMLPCLLQPPVYGWVIGWMCTTDRRRRAGIWVLIATHFLIVAGVFIMQVMT